MNLQDFFLKRILKRMINDSVLKEIKAFGVHADWDDAFGGTSTGNRHLFRVVEIAEYIAKQEDVDVSVVLAGAALHDISLGMGDGNDYDPEINIKNAEEVLERFDMSDEDKRIVARCIALHEGTGVGNFEYKESQIVHDADVLEKTGVLGLIRHTWKSVHINNIDPKNVNKDDLRTVLGHIQWRGERMQTKTGKELHDRVAVTWQEDRGLELLRIIARKVSEGMITEDIAEVLYPILTDGEREKLKSQLELTFLKK